MYEPFPGRTFILATNVAETSITVPTVKYVVDCGFYKNKVFDGIWKWRLEGTSQAMAQQRAGRAGRVSKGYCYRLYSPAVYSRMPPHSAPQVDTIPLETIVLQLKLARIEDVLSFPFPTMPSHTRLSQAVLNLISLQALEGDLAQNKLTKLGEVVAFLPISPRFGKLLLIAHKLGYAR